MPYVPTSVSKKKVILIPNGVNTEDFNDAIEKNKELESKFGLKIKFVVMFARNLGVANDIHTILNTAKLLKDVKEIVFVLIRGGIKK